MSPSSHSPAQSLPIGLLLGLTGGIMNSYTYLNRGGVFVTAETGNLVLLGMHLAQGNWRRALSCLVPILFFSLGVLTAEFFHLRHPQREHALPWRQVMILTECIVICIVSMLPLGRPDPLATLLISFQSAIQMQSFRSFLGCPCATTFCTGNLRSGTESLFHFLARRDLNARTHTCVYYGVILAFVTGALLDSVLSPLFRGRTILLCCIPLLSVFFLLRRQSSS